VGKISGEQEVVGCGHPFPTSLTTGSFSGKFRNGILKTTVSLAKGPIWMKLGIAELHYNLSQSDFGLNRFVLSSRD
jgi:hypothetical protein